MKASAAGRNRKGCLLVNTALEVSSHDPEVAQVVNASLDQGGVFRAMIKAAQKEGTIRAEISASETARLLFGQFLGLRVISRSCPEPKRMATIARQAETLLV